MGGRSCKWRECVSGVGRDNGDEQVKKVELFRPRANEISQEQWDGKRQCVCHATQISASGGLGINSLCQKQSALNFCIKLIMEGQQYKNHIH